VSSPISRPRRPRLERSHHMLSLLDTKEKAERVLDDLLEHFR
jgi:hypothetical protein